MPAPQVWKYTQREEVEEGAMLCKAGEFNDKLYVLQSGRLTSYSDYRGPFVHPTRTLVAPCLHPAGNLLLYFCVPSLCHTFLPLSSPSEAEEFVGTRIYTMMRGACINEESLFLQVRPFPFCRTSACVSS
jgi:CRP-like cAMP-binding protein